MDNIPSRADRQRKREIPRQSIYIAVTVGVVALAVVLLLVLTGDRDGNEYAYEELSQKQIENAMSNVKEPITEQRQTIIDSGMSLLGKVHYFWGGKSFAVGWDDAWGQPKVVTEEGSSKTGQEIPYGLDCSGYVAWCFVQTGLSREQINGKLGQGTYHQWQNSDEISWSEILPGDLAFQNIPPSSENHVGICIGFSDDGAPVFVHCAATFDNVVVTGRGEVFNYPRRPKLYED